MYDGQCELEELSQDVARGREDRGLYDGRNVSGVSMWLEVGATEESMVEWGRQEGRGRTECDGG